MGIHSFDFDVFDQGQAEQQSYVGKPTVFNDKESILPDSLGDPGSRQNDERNLALCNKEKLPCSGEVEDTIDINFVEEVRETYPRGFHLMDRGIKNYFSGIRIPISKGNEEYRIMSARVTGADPEALIYSDRNLVGGRLQLPMLAISRKGETFDPKRYTPPLRPFTRHFLCNGKKSEYVYRPVPFLIDYTLEIWAEHKSDAEYALYAITSKLNPIGSFFLEEKSMGMSFEVIVHPGGSVDESDLETDPESRAEIKKSITLKVEGWLPTPTKVVDNILATPAVIKEGLGSPITSAGETFAVIYDDS